MLEDVGEGLDGEERQGNRHVPRHIAVHDVGLDRKPVCLAAQSAGDLLGELLDQSLQIDGRLILDLMQDAMDKGERIDAHLGLHQRVARRRVAQLARLKA